VAARNGKAKLVGVMGDPITHSLSPAIHEFWLQHYGINGAYVPLKVSPANFEAAVKIYTTTGFVGLNVTLPHKQTAYAMMDSVDDASASCRAVNTVVVQKSGALHGMNTDAYGFLKMVEEMQEEEPFGLEHVLILGAGGSARAVIYTLLQLGCKSVVIANRTVERGQYLMEDMRLEASGMQVKTISLSDAIVHAKEAHCLINTLSIGQSTDVNLAALIKQTPSYCVILDVSYSHFGTETTRAAEAVKRRTRDGFPMLLWQAVSGFEQWFGVTPEVNDALITYVRTIAKAG
jgi:shikimate dehydrogenase